MTSEPPAESAEAALSEDAKARLIEADRRLLELARGIRVLTPLSWPADVQEPFLAAWRRGERRMPDVKYEREPQAERIAALEALVRTVDEEHPLGRFIADTARSYVTVCWLLEHAGTPRMTDFSIALYGRPGDSLAGGRVNNVDAATHFLEVSSLYKREWGLEPLDYCVAASVVKEELERRIAKVFDRHTIEIVIDPHLVSKAAAGATRIRLRDATCFSDYDIEQLLQHEAFIHSLTAINGRQQPHIRSLGLAAPRTTGTQEGLATFAELITGAIDIGRLERIALRIVAIEKALAGADFMEVFEFFLESGQDDTESFNSAMRVFRGAPLGGGSAFTKDTVYLHGLMEVHTFFRWCLQHERLELCRHLLAGRMAIDDVIRLEPCFREGLLAPPTYLPPWMGRTNALSGYLAFSVFANRIRIAELHEGYTFDRVSDLGV
jgi:uncharacterized protein (TIGR02421 family)